MSYSPPFAPQTRSREKILSNAVHILQVKSLTILIVAAHAATATLIATALGLDQKWEVFGKSVVFATIFLPVFVFIFLISCVFQIAFVEHSRHPVDRLRDLAFRKMTDPARLLEGTAVMLVLFVFIQNFSFIKTAIPLIHPFSWDIYFSQMDQILFLGTQPWQISFDIFGNSMATTAINFAYNIWFFVMYGFIFFAAYSRHPLRHVYILAFLLLWFLGGNVLATIFSSAGPVFFARLGFGETYDLQMSMLQAFSESRSVWSLAVQEMLWASYTQETDSVVRGISAMPSMHCASAVLFALFGFRISRALGWIMTAFAAVILVGSVHLAWHYAVDGIAGAFLAWACWRTALYLGKFSKVSES